MAFRNNQFIRCLEFHELNRKVTIATVVRVSGSTPQKTGSTAVFGNIGLLSGTIGGGVMEGRVKDISLAAAENGKSTLVEFDLANDIQDKTEAICGGYATVLVDANPEESAAVFIEMKNCLLGQQSGVLVTGINHLEGSEVDIERAWISSSEIRSIHQIPDKVWQEAIRLIAPGNRAGFKEIDSEPVPDGWTRSWFLQPFFPPEKLVIAGAGHIGRALAHLGGLLDFEVTVIDDRPEFANPSNIPDADHLIVSDIGQAMEALNGGSDTFVVIVTRGHKDDALALRPCLSKVLAYTGMIGSRIKIDAMHDEFIARSWTTEEQWRKIHAPVGLPVLSHTVEEIAVSIAAELVLVRNSRSIS